MMRRFLLLCFFIIPLLVQSQVKEAEQLQFEGQDPLQKSDLIGLDVNQLIDLGFGNIENLNTSSTQTNQIGGDREDCFDAYIPVDPATYTPVPRNDDGSLLIQNLGFTFSFCGTSYTDCYINTNGNLSFGSAVAQFSPDGFPFGTPMVAPFWADVDTRNEDCGQAWYRLFPNYMIVTWEDVGWFNQMCNPLNSFQVIISDGTAPIIGVGNNIQFRYGDMEWTTGTASGGGPFGGFAATVGHNSGDGVNFEQIGRFNVNDSSYDGPFGNNDGVHYLDFRCYVFDSAGGSFTLECNDISKALDANCLTSVTPEEIATTTSSGCATIELEIDISDFGCDDLGPNIVTITATSGGQIETCTAIVDVTNGLCSAPLIDPVSSLCGEDFPFTLSASPPGGTWSPNAPGGVFDPSLSGPGSHEVIYTFSSGCPTTVSTFVTVNEAPQVSIAPDPPEFCENDGFVELVATGTGGDGNYNFEWTTPFGNQSGSSILANFAGLYSVTITDGNGCNSFAFTNVAVNPNPIIMINDPGPICNSEIAIQLTATPPGGVWTGVFVTPDGFIFPQNMPIGFTQVTYTYMNSFGCESSQTSDIEVLASPDALAFNDGPYCEGEPIQLSGNTNAPGVAIYSWIGPNNYTSGDQNPTNATEPGAYILEVTVDGCPSELAPTIVEVTQAPDALAFNDGPYCAGQSINLFGSTTASGTVTTYEWLGPNNYSSFSQNPTNATVDGIYTLIVTVDGCPSESSFTQVDFTAPPDAIAQNLGPYCEGDDITLIGGTSTNGTIITYSWTGPNNYTSGNQNPADVTEPGTYILEVNVDGCLSNLESTEVLINPLPQPIITGDNTFCDGNNSILDAGSGFAIYEWSTGDGSQTTVVDATGLISVTVTDGNGCTGETSFSVTQNPNPVPSITGLTSFCTGDATSLDAGGGYDLYEWSNGMFTQTISVSNPGDYTVIVTDANGCTGEAMVTVVENNALTPVITGDLSLCQGEASLLNAGDGFLTYEWFDGTMDQTILVDATGDYSVTVTDVNGCTGEDMVSLIVNDNPSPTISGEDAFCEDSTSDLDAGAGFSEYAWSNGSSTQVTTIDATGTYIVTVTDGNGCTGETQFTITENQNPSPTITGDDAFCQGAGVALDAGSGYDEYDWSEGSSTQTIDITTGNTYSVTVTDANGCTGETEFIVTENTITPPDITGLIEFCDGDASILDAGTGYNIYEWSDNTGNQTVTVASSGIVSVTVTDANGCTAEDQVDITVNSNLTPQILGQVEFCDGDFSTLDAGSFDTYEWSDGSDGQTLDVTASGTYSVTVTDTNGCSGEDEINITANPNPNPSIAGSTSFCTGFSTIIDAGSGYDIYEWQDGSNGQTFEVSIGGTYTVIVTDGNGCTGEATIDVEESSSLNPVISGDLEYCIGSSTILDAGAGFDTYEWSNGAFTQTITVNSPDDYSVIVTDINGCSGETVVSIIENNLPTLSILGNEPICTGANIILDAGAGFDDYEWSNASLNQTIDVTLGGAYSVTVTDANNCTNEASVVVIENPNPTPVITGDQSFCVGETVTLDAGSFDQFEWSDGSGLSTLGITSGGTYSVIVTDINGCTGEDQFTVAENQLPIPEITGDLEFCEGNSTTLNAPDNFDYEWSNGSDQQSISINLDGSIGLTVTDANGCTGETSATLIENQNPDPTISGSSTFCIGNSTIIDAGAGYETYTWSNGTLNQTLEVTIAGDYEVTVTDANGCIGITQINIIESQSLQPVILGDLIVCDGEASILDAGAGFDTYTWSTGEITQTITVDTDNNYTVTVSDTQGCTGENSVAFAVNQNPLAEITGLDVLCEGETSTLDAGGGYDSYLWSNGEITQTIEVSTSETFGVTVTDTNGCVDETQINVIVNPNPTPQIIGPSSFCSGNSAILDAGAGYNTYEWSTGEMTQSITVEDGAFYSVTVTSAEGCSGEIETEVIENSSLTPAIFGDLDFCEGDNSILEAGNGFSTYEWSTGEMTQSISVTEDGNYSVTVTDTDGCSGTTNVTVATFQNPEPIIAGSSTFCTGSFSTLDAGNYDSFVWSTGEITQTIEVNTPGIYTVDVIDQNACAGTASVNITESTSLNPVISGLPAFCTGGTTELSAGAGFETYEWSDGSFGQTLEVSIAQDYGLTVSDATGCTGETTISVIENTPPSAGTAILPPDFCADEIEMVSLGDLLVNQDPNGIWTEVSNIPSQNGAFNAGNATFDMSGQTSGTYVFEYTISSFGACPGDSEQVEVIINELPIVIAGASIELDCANPSLSLDAMGSSMGPNFEIQWTGGVVVDGNENTIAPTVDLPGMYTLTITNLQTGCSASDQVEVTESADTPSAFAGNDNQLTCDDTEITLQAGGDIGTGFEVEWQGPSITMDNMNEINPVVDLAGLYILTITNTDNGCVSSPDSVTVINNNLAPELVIELPLNLDCNNESIAIIGNSSNVDVSFEWLNNNVSIGIGSSIDGIDLPGMYTLVVTDNQTGCTGSETIEVFQDIEFPSAEAGLPQIIDCYTPEVTLDGSGSQTGPEIIYNWTGPNVSGIPTEAITAVNQSGMYIISVIDNSNGCESFDTVFVDLNTTPPNAIIMQPDQLDCTINEVSLDGSGSSSGNNFIYSWIDQNGNELASGNNNIDVQSTGTYFLAIQDTNNGCVDTTSIIVSENMDVPNSAVFLINNPDCFGDDDGSISVPEVIGGMAPYVFSINDEAFVTTGFYTQLTPGSYDLMIQDANGCEWDTTINIIQPIDTEINLGTNLELIMGDSATVQATINIPLENLDTIIWTPADLIDCGDPDCLEVGFSSFYSQVLTATVIDINGCTDEDDISVNIDRQKNVYIPNVFTPDGDSQNDVFMIFGNQEHIVKVNKFMVFNRWGELLFEQFNFQPNNPINGWDGNFRGEIVNPAVFVYLAEIEFIDGEVLLYKGDVTLVR